MSSTVVVAPVAGRAVALGEVPDPVFSQGMVGYGAAVDPPRGIVEAVAPVSGKLLKLLPHAYVIMTADNVGVLVHLRRPPSQPVRRRLMRWRSCRPAFSLARPGQANSARASL